MGGLPWGLVGSSNCSSEVLVVQGISSALAEGRRM